MVVLEPNTQKFLDSLTGATPVETLPPDEARKVLSTLQASVKYDIPASVEDLNLNIGPTGKLLVRVVRPQNAKGDLHPIIYMHGGGWVLADREVFDRHIRHYANLTGAAIFFVEYDRSPEAKFPTAVEQGYATAEYVAQNASQLKVDASKLVISGDSAGGNMTAAICLMAKERKGPKITSQVMFYPAVSSGMDTDSYSTFGKAGLWLTSSMMKWFWDAYCPQDQRKDIRAAPFYATKEQLQGLPEALIITAENDVLRDEGEEYARKLANAGVRVTATRYLGTIHDFILLNTIYQTPAPTGAVEQAAAHIRTHFAQK